MGVKVIDKAGQKEVEVSSTEAQQAILDGRAALPAGKVKVRAAGNRTGTVDADKLGEALAEGWQIADEAEVAQATIRREESDLGSSIAGGIEAGLAGATLGASTWAEAELLGMDPERMRARREGLGSLSTGLEVAGALAPAVLSGGASLGAAGTRAGLAARAAAASPAGALARGGALAERGLGAALAEAPALVRTVVPVAGRGMVEGFAAGVGAEVDDAVLGERDLVAENLLAAGGMGALLGGGAGALVPGLAAAGAGITKVPQKYVREIVGKLSGSADDQGSSLWTRAMSDEGLVKYAHLNNLDPEDVLHVGRKLRTPEGAKELDRYLNDASGVSEEIAGSMRTPFERLKAARAKVRQEFGGQQKILHIERNLPREADRLVTAHERSIGVLDDLEGSLKQASPLASAGDLRTIKTMIDEARVEIGAAARSATGRSGARQVAAVTHRALDRVKQGVFSIKDGYRRISRSGAPTRESQVMGELLDGVPGRQGVYDRLRTHLEDEDLWGEAGAIQQALNVRSAGAINSRRALKGSASGRLLDPNAAVVDNADLLAVTRQAGGRFSGATKTELLEDAVAAEGAYLDEALKRLDLSPQARAAIAEYKASAKQIDDAFRAQREKVRTLDATERFRVSEGNRSPSITGASTIGAEVARNVGTGLGAALGSVIGPVGTLLGAGAGRALGEVASLATRPFTLTRKLAAIRARSSGVKDAQREAMGGFLKQITDGAGAAGRAIGESSERASKALAQGAGQSGGRNERIAAARTRVLALAGASGPNLDDEIRTMTLDMDDVAPNVAGVVAARTQRAVAYLASKAPAAYQAPYSNRTPLIDPVAAAEFERRVEAVTNPTRSLARLADGTFTREHAEALRETSPALYERAQQDCLAALAEAQAKGVSVPLKTVTQLSLFMGIDADPTLAMAPAIAMALAAPAPPPPPQGAAPQPSRKSANVEIDTDRVAAPSSGVGTME
jgi:hypothetical protein